MPLTYGEYYPRSALVYAAVKLRQDSVSRVPLKVFRRGDGVPRPASLGIRGQGLGSMSSRAVDSAEPVGKDHPAQRLLDAPNPFWTRSDLWRATETYLGLWGSAFWGLERDQAALLVANGWRGLTSANSLIETPSIEAVPEREEHVIRYTVTLTMRLDPI